MVTVFVSHPPDKLDTYFGAKATAGAARRSPTIRFNDAPGELSLPELVAAARGCDALIAYRQTAAPEALFRELPELFAFIRCAVDIRTVDVAAASAHGVLVTQASPGFVAAVAEWVVAVMIDLGRGIGRYAEAGARRAPARAVRRPRAARLDARRDRPRPDRRAAAPTSALALRHARARRDAAADRRPRRTHPPGRRSIELLARVGLRRLPRAGAAPTPTNLMDAAAFAAMRRGAFFVNAVARRARRRRGAARRARRRATSAAPRSTSAARPTRCRRRSSSRHPRVHRDAAHRRPDAAGDRAPGARDRRPAGAAAAGRDAGRRRQPGPCRSLAALARPAPRRSEPHDDLALALARMPATATCTSTKTRYPLAPTATFKPPHAPASAYRAVQRELGLARARSSSSRPATASTTAARSAALAALGPEARAVVVVAAGRRAPPSSQSLHDARRPRRPLHDAARRRAAVVGARAHARRAIAPLGWHIDLQLDGRELPQHEAMLARLPCRLVIDHVGRFMGPVEPDSEPLARALPAARHAATAGSRSRRRTRARAAGRRATTTSPAIARADRAALPRALPVGEQLAAPEPEAGAVERGDARLGPRLHAPTRRAAPGAGRQPGRALRLHAGRRHVNCAQPSAPHGLSRKPLRRRRAERRRQVEPRQGAARARLAPRRSRSRTRRESRAARSSTAASTTSSTSRPFAP